MTAGAQGAIRVITDGNPWEFNFASDINNWSTNTYAPVFVVTNEAWIAYQVDFGTDNTNINVGIIVK